MLSNIPCPDCGENIAVQMDLFIQGKSFSCGGCKASISLMPQDMALVKASMDQLKQFKQSQESAG